MRLLFGHLVMALAGVVSGLSLNWKPTPPSGHMMNGVNLRAAGVVPYTVRPGLGVHFLLQSMTNGSRTGKLCDFGGRRESSDEDAFVTAARELCEEVGGNFFGDVDELADKLRSEAKVRILNRHGRYVTFFVKVPYAPAEMLPTVCARTLRM